MLIVSQTLAQNNKRDSADIEGMARILDKYAHEVMNSNDVKEKQNSVRFYFQTFPDNFETFSAVYDSRRNVEEWLPPLVKHALFDILPSLREIIPENEYYEKLIGVGIGGFWNADNVGALSHHLWQLIPENITLSIRVLEEYEEKEIRSFWYFLYDGPHPEHPFNRKHYEELYPRIRDNNPHIAEQLKQAYEQLLSENDGHGH
ncbi:MAG: hypothetical protein OXH02_07385 [Gemmatimonadetes bacterium]|nr:hypothetical protein [Gemmatimonadota bacterium]